MLGPGANRPRPRLPAQSMRTAAPTHARELNVPLSQILKLQLPAAPGALLTLLQSEKRENQRKQTHRAWAWLFSGFPGKDGRARL